MALTNTGSLSVQSGTLALTGGGSSSASGITVASGATLDFASGIFTLSAGAIGGSGLTEVTAGTLELGSNAVSLASFKQVAATVDGSGTLTVSGAGTFTGVDIETGSGTTLLQGTTADSATIYLDGGRTLENAGTLNVKGSGAFVLGGLPSGAPAGGGTIKNDAGATFNFQAGASSVSAGAGVDTFVNAGLLEQTVTAGTTTIGVALTNTGSLSVQSGTLALTGGGSSAASAITVASGATLDFASGIFTLTAGAISGSGLTEVTAGTLELGSNAVSLASFKQVAATVDGSGTLTVSGAGTFTGVDIETGSGTTLLQGTTADSATIYLDGGRTLENAGTLNVKGGGSFVLGGLPSGTPAGGATIKNDAGATFDFQAASSISAGAGVDTFVNAGLLEQTVTGGTTTIGVALTNTGSLSVQSGTLALTGGGSSAASGITVASGATLDFASGIFTLTAGAISGSGLTEVTAGTLELGSNAVSLASFKQVAATVDGSGTLTVSGAGTFTGVDIETGSGTTLLQGTTADSATIYLDGGRTLENAGTLNVKGSGAFVLGGLPSGTPAGGATIKNDAGATFNFQAGASSVSAGAGVDTFVNAGLLEQTVTGGTTTIGVALTNTGSLSVQSGTLALTGGGSSSASGITVASGATLDFASGIFTLTAGAISGSGLTEVTAGTLELGSNAVSLASFKQVAATVDGSGTLTVSGAGTFTGVDIETGSGTTLLQGTTADSATIYLDGGRTLENAGTLNVTGSGAFVLGGLPSGTPAGGGTIKNDAGATFDFQAASSISADDGVDTFVNAGLLEQTVTGGNTTIGVTLTNTGSLSVQSGTLTLTGGGSSSASGITVASGATLAFDGGLFSVSGGAYNVSGATEVSTSPVFQAGGTLDLSGASSANFGAGLVVAGGTLLLGDVAATTSSLQQNGGTISGTAELIVSGAAVFALANYDVQSGSGTTLLKGLTSDNGAFLSLDGGRVLENAGVFNAAGGGVFILGYDPSGSSVGGATIQNDYGATFNFKASEAVYAFLGADVFLNAGLVVQTVTQGVTLFTVAFQSTGKVSVTSGTMQFDGVGNIFSGGVQGAGAIVFGGGSTSFSDGATLAISELSIADDDTQVTVSTNLSFAGSFDEGAGTMLSIADDDMLALSGATSLDGETTGLGTLSLTGGSTSIALGASLDAGEVGDLRREHDRYAQRSAHLWRDVLAGLFVDLGDLDRRQAFPDGRGDPGRHDLGRGHAVDDRRLHVDRRRREADAGELDDLRREHDRYAQRSADLWRGVLTGLFVDFCDLDSRQALP